MIDQAVQRSQGFWLFQLAQTLAGKLDLIQPAGTLPALDEATESLLQRFARQPAGFQLERTDRGRHRVDTDPLITAVK